MAEGGGPAILQERIGDVRHGWLLHILLCDFFRMILRAIEEMEMILRLDDVVLIHICLLF